MQHKSFCCFKTVFGVCEFFKKQDFTIFWAKTFFKNRPKIIVCYACGYKIFPLVLEVTKICDSFASLTQTLGNISYITGNRHNIIKMHIRKPRKTGLCLKIRSKSFLFDSRDERFFLALHCFPMCILHLIAAIPC